MEFNQEFFTKIVRYVLTFLGGYLANKGLADAELLEAAGGFATACVAIGFSIAKTIKNNKEKKKLDNAE